MGEGSSRGRGQTTEQVRAQEDSEGRRLSSRLFMNGWVWYVQFPRIPEEGGTATTAEGAETAKELVSGEESSLAPVLAPPW